MVRALLNAGADKTIANMHGGSKPIDVVCEWGDNKQHKDAIVALLGGEPEAGSAHWMPW